NAESDHPLIFRHRALVTGDTLVATSRGRWKGSCARLTWLGQPVSDTLTHSGLSCPTRSWETRAGYVCSSLHIADILPQFQERTRWQMTGLVESLENTGLPS